MYNSRLAKPKVSEVKNWIFQSDDSTLHAAVLTADIDDFFFKVVPLFKGAKTKYFYGETAWQDARRYANDLYNPHL